MGNTQASKKNKKQTRIYKKCDLDQISRRLKSWRVDIKMRICNDPQPLFRRLDNPI